MPKTASSASLAGSLGSLGSLSLAGSGNTSPPHLLVQKMFPELSELETTRNKKLLGLLAVVLGTRTLLFNFALLKCLYKYTRDAEEPFFGRRWLVEVSRKVQRVPKFGVNCQCDECDECGEL